MENENYNINNFKHQCCIYDMTSLGIFSIAFFIEICVWRSVATTSGDIARTFLPLCRVMDCNAWHAIRYLHRKTFEVKTYKLIKKSQYVNNFCSGDVTYVKCLVWNYVIPITLLLQSYNWMCMSTFICPSIQLAIKRVICLN